MKLRLCCLSSAVQRKKSGAHVTHNAPGPSSLGRISSFAFLISEQQTSTGATKTAAARLPTERNRRLEKPADRRPEDLPDDLRASRPGGGWVLSREHLEARRVRLSAWRHPSSVRDPATRPRSPSRSLARSLLLRRPLRSEPGLSAQTRATA